MHGEGYTAICHMPISNTEDFCRQLLGFSTLGICSSYPKYHVLQVEDSCVFSAVRFSSTPIKKGANLE